MKQLQKKVQQILSSIGIDKIDISLRDGPFSGDIGMGNIHHFQGTSWALYIHECFFDSCGC